MITAPTAATFPCRVAPFTGKLRVKITSFGVRSNGLDGDQGSITDLYTHPELWVYCKNSLAHTGYDQPTGLRFDVEGRPPVYIALPWRVKAAQP